MPLPRTSRILDRTKRNGRQMTQILFAPPGDGAFSVDAELDLPPGEFLDPAQQLDLIIEQRIPPGHPNYPAAGNGQVWVEGPKNQARGGDQLLARGGAIACGFEFNPANDPAAPRPTQFRIRVEGGGDVTYGVLARIESL